MISHKYKFIFIHVPKCAGLSLFHNNKIKHGIDYKLPLQNGHYSQKEYYDQFGTSLDQYNQFLVCRNPFDRFVSSFEFLKKGGMWKGDEDFAKRHNMQNKSFKDFVCELGKFENGAKYFSKVHFFTMYSFIEYKPEKLEIIKFENLQEDFDIICDKIDIPNRKLPHLNKTKHKHYTEYYDEETKQIVAERYAKDIEHFGYKFGE